MGTSVRPLWAFLIWLLASACAQNPVKRYASVLDPHVGTGKKEEMDRILGEPTFCRQESVLQKCEYRTASLRNGPVPEVYRKTKTMPDVSPYDYFDVIHLFYDNERVLKEWQAIVVKP